MIEREEVVVGEEEEGSRDLGADSCTSEGRTSFGRRLWRRRKRRRRSREESRPRVDLLLPPRGGRIPEWWRGFGGGVGRNNPFFWVVVGGESGGERVGLSRF